MGAVPAVDAALQRLRALLGEGIVSALPERSFGAPVPPVPSWTGRAATAAHTASDALNHRRTQLADTHAALSPLVVAAGELAATARKAPPREEVTTR